MFIDNKYVINDYYHPSVLFVGNLEYASSKYSSKETKYITTNEKFLFELVSIDNVFKYREVFTGLTVFDSNMKIEWDVPYAINLVNIKEAVPNIKDKVSKDSLLFLMDYINKEKVLKK